jgi:hypothetical protein
LWRDDISPNFVFSHPKVDHASCIYWGNAVRPVMITNGLYSITTKLLDGVRGGATGISVLRNGKSLVAVPSFIILGAMIVPMANGRVK